MGYLTISDICERSGFDRATVWRKRQAGSFPQPANDDGHPRWRAPVVDAWVNGLSWSERSPAWRAAAERFYRWFRERPGPIPHAPWRYDELKEALARIEAARGTTWDTQDDGGTSD